MSDMTNGNKGTQAYRWLVTIGMALITALSWRQLDQIDKMAAKLETLQIQVTTLSSTTEGRSNASARDWIQPNVATIARTSRSKSCSGGCGRSRQPGAHDAS